MPARCFKGGNPTLKRFTITQAAAILFSATLSAQVGLQPRSVPQDVFAGPDREILATFHNPDGSPHSISIRGAVHQTTSASAVRVSEIPARTLDLKPGATIIEHFSADFPEVRVPTLFLIQWITDDSILGVTKIEVFPEGIIKDFGEGIGVFDPGGTIRSAFDSLNAATSNIEPSGWDAFSGRLAIVLAAGKRGQTTRMKSEVLRLADRGIHTLWLIEPPRVGESLRPSYFAVPKGRANIVVADRALLDNLASSPRAQSALLDLVRHASDPKPFPLPE